ncbi:hypothetical protein JXA02_07720 [candidate division KSB1 bacterium]|nr:hypothetical protein [candidate division KSB1 bacterium]RQW06262.1 MAG: hypothetical protein EH222_08980 [candidate division KSB1 bacterium]
MRRLFSAALFILIVSHSATAQHSGIGVGLILGEPTGISVKNWLNSGHSLNGAAAWSFVDTGALHVHIDYVFHNFDLIKPEVGKMALYYGLGGRLKLTTDSRLGIRVPVGLNYMLQDNPLDLFLELVPMLDLVPATSFTINAAIGIRYFF